jgi:Fungalysin metallopeptidase (M36)/Fungalysin/Thermolysin Propeptide Motif
MTETTVRTFRLPLAVLVLTCLLPVAAAAAGLENEAARAIAFDYLETHHAALGLDAADLGDVVVGDQYVSRHTGTSHVYLHQRHAGIEVYNAILALAVTADGRVAHVGNRLVADLAAQANAPVPSLSPTAAVERAAAALGLAPPAGLRVVEQHGGADRPALLSDGGISLANIPAKLVYQPLANGRVRLAWDLVLELVDQSHWWSLRIDAESGQLLDKNDLLVYESYEVYPIPIESPNHTAPPPPADARTIVTDPFTDSLASPFGWHDTDGDVDPDFTITRGNNVHAYADANADNVPDGGANAEPDGGAALDFTGAVVPIDLSLSPSSYTQASIANLFYWTNIIHDVLWEYGFDEPAGNFQVDNYGNGGLGGDDVRAEAQDGSGNCNANFGTPADGMRPRMQMYTCTNTSPARDGSLDHGVVTHEFGHGVSNRLTGGPAAAGCLSNTEQMGEGWSDYLGLMLTQEPGDAATDARGTGTYLFGQAANGPGIRPAPYSTDFGVNSFTYSGISGVSIPHGVGFVWATMLWQMTWELIGDHGFNPDVYDDWTTGGNNLALQLVIDGMKLQPCFPGFVDGRDAILAADDLLTGDGSELSGANQCPIWSAFAIRGLGASADQGDSTSVQDGTQAFDLPAACETIGAVQTVRNICQGDTATYRIGVGDQFTAPPVDLSAAGEPAGTTASFSIDPVASTPGISDFEVTDTAAAAAGSYSITITGTDTTPTMFDTAVELNVFAAAPASGPSLTAPADSAVDQPTQPTFTWTAVAGALTYTLEIDDDPGFGSIDYTASGLAGTSHTPSVELGYLTTYYWRVRGDNPCGGGTDSAVFSFTTALFPGDCAPGFAAQVAFEDDLEGGAAGWTSSGTGDTWTLSDARVTSGANAFFGVDPPTLSDQRLVSPAIALPSETPLTLQFQNYQAFETPNADGRCWDAGILEVSTNGGTTWSQVPAGAMLTDPYDNVLWNNTPGNNPISTDYGATNAWCDELQPFTASVVDVGAWAGQTVRFRWRLGSDSAAGNEGWYVDDVKVQSCVDARIFADGFESGDTSGW